MLNSLQVWDRTPLSGMYECSSCPGKTSAKDKRVAGLVTSRRKIGCIVAGIT